MVFTVLIIQESRRTRIECASPQCTSPQCTSSLPRTVLHMSSIIVQTTADGLGPDKVMLSEVLRSAS